VALELEDRRSHASDEYVDSIIQALIAERDQGVRSRRNTHFANAAGRLEPISAVRALCAALSHETDAITRSSLTQALADVIRSAEPSVASGLAKEAARSIAAKLEQESDANARSILARSLSKVTARLDRREAGEFCGKAALVLANTADPQNTMLGMRFFAEETDGLVELSDRLEPAEAVRILANALCRKRQQPSLETLARGLSKISQRLQPQESALVCGGAAQAIAAALTHQIGLDAAFTAFLALELSEIARQMEPAETARVCRQPASALAGALENMKNTEDVPVWASALANLSIRLDPPDAERLCGQGARSITAALERETSADDCGRLTTALELLAVRMDRGAAAHACGQAARSIMPHLERVNPTQTVFYGTPAVPLVSMTGRMDPAEAASLLAASVERAKNPVIRREIVASLASVTSRLGAREGGRICMKAAQALVTALKRQRNDNVHTALAEDVVLLLARLDKTDEVQTCGQASQVLAAAVEHAPDAYSRWGLVGALLAVVAHLDPAEAARIRGGAARVVGHALEREMDATARNTLAQSLVSLAGLNDESQSGGYVAYALARESDGQIRKRLVSEATSLVGKPDRTEAATITRKAAGVLAAALHTEKDDEARKPLAAGLASIADRLDPSEDAMAYEEAARSLADSLSRNPDRKGGPPGSMFSEDPDRTLASSLRSVVDRMAPAEAVKVVAAALRNGSNPESRAELAQILCAIAARLPESEANRVCDELIASVNSDPLDWGAGELLPQLPQERAHALAWQFATQICSKPDLNADLTTVSRVLNDTGRAEMRRRTKRMAARAGPGIEGAVEAAVRISSEPFTCRLTTQELVNLLKMPTCFGAARRIVLDHLGNRYGRRFVNHWAFVLFATEQNLSLDFTTPPSRPRPTHEPTSRSSPKTNLQ
jgi:hypothetical protein